MHLIRDVLDTQLIGRDGRRLGKVDGLVIELREGAPPRVAFIETGVNVLARRLGPRLAYQVAYWRERICAAQRDNVRISWSQVRDVGVDIEVEADETSATQLQNWLLRHVISHLPGGMR
jgi:sporulation protein YlmC with PRC-barrel domain